MERFSNLVDGWQLLENNMRGENWRQQKGQKVKEEESAAYVYLACSGLDQSKACHLMSQHMQKQLVFSPRTIIKMTVNYHDLE